MDRVKGYKTLILNVAIAAVGVMMTFEWVSVMPAAWIGLTLAALGALNVYLRSITTTAVMKSK